MCGDGMLNVWCASFCGQPTGEPQWLQRVESGDGHERSDQIWPRVSNSFGVAAERLRGDWSMAANNGPLRIRIAGRSDIEPADVLGMIGPDVAGKTTRCGRRPP